jgi:hypothetical protein
VNKHIEGCKGVVCDGYQASQLGIALLKHMLSDQEMSHKKLYFESFKSYIDEKNTATKLLQALLFWMKHVPKSLLSDGLTNIQNDRNAVAHNGGFVQAMFGIDRTTVVGGEHATDEEIKSFYHAIKRSKSHKEIDLNTTINS